MKYSVILLLVLLGCSRPVSETKPDIVYSQECFATNYAILTDGTRFRIRHPNGYTSKLLDITSKSQAERIIKGLCKMYIQEENDKHSNWTEVK